MVRPACRRCWNWFRKPRTKALARSLSAVPTIPVLKPRGVVAACPVIGIGQAAYHLAALAGSRFSVVTTLDVSTPILVENIEAYGLGGSLGKVRAAGVPVLALENEPDASASKVFDEIGRAQREDDIQSVVLGCAGMSHIPARAGPEVTVRLIDGVKAAVQIGALL